MDANGEARWLTRRLLRAGPRSGAARWAALVSVWGHLLLLIGLALTRAQPAPRPAPRPPPLHLVLLEPAPPPAHAEPSLDPGHAVPGGGGGEGGAPDPDEGGAPQGTSGGAVQAWVLADAPRRSRVAPPSADDPVEELRQSLGIEPVDRSRLARERTARAAMFGELAQGLADEPGDDPDLPYRPADELHGSSLGAYVAKVEQLVYARWRASDLAIHSRAIGLQGDVSVRYSIARDGTVSDVRISRASGLAEIDQLAIRAIPPRLPRLPPDLGLPVLNHEITFRYHNPP